MNDVTSIIRQGRDGVYREMKEGRLKFIKIGKKNFFTPKHIGDYVALVQREAEEGRPILRPSPKRKSAVQTPQGEPDE